MFLKDRTIPRAALTWDDSGNNIAYQTGRAAFVINPPSVWYWMVDNDKSLLGNSVDGQRAEGSRAERADRQCGRLLGVAGVEGDPKHPDFAKDWLRYFFQPDHYRAVIEKVGGRWAPIYPKMFDTLPLFADNPAFKDFKTLAQRWLPRRLCRAAERARRARSTTPTSSPRCCRRCLSTTQRSTRRWPGASSRSRQLAKGLNVAQALTTHAKGRPYPFQDDEARPYPDIPTVDPPRQGLVDALAAIGSATATGELYRMGIRNPHILRAVAVDAGQSGRRARR